MIRHRIWFSLIFAAFLAACGGTATSDKHARIGFLDMLTDETLSQARKGFFVALKDKGYVSPGSLEILYRNAQGDQTMLQQACSFLVSQQVDLIATCPTLPTLVAVQQTHDIPVFMMVTPRPDLAGLVDSKGLPPANLLGVYESLEYLDTAVLLIRHILPGMKKLGAVYNQSEPQSVLALERIRNRCRETGTELVVLPVNNSNETQLVVAAVLDKKPDAFFALPDNVVFASMEVLVKACDDAHIPVFTSEEGLVRRGAVAAFGADMYRWGYQCGLQAASYLSGKRDGMKPVSVEIRRKVYNPEKAAAYGLVFDSSFTTVH